MGGGTSLFMSSFTANVYYNPAEPGWKNTSFPCRQGYGPVNPAEADGVLYGGQALEKGQVLLSHRKQAWASMRANGQQSNLLGFTKNLLENTDGVVHTIIVLSRRQPATLYFC